MPALVVPMASLLTNGTRATVVVAVVAAILVAAVHASCANLPGPACVLVSLIMWLASPQWPGLSSRAVGWVAE